ncbi:peptide ABC transporter substrate-binding protein [Aneurinibacillus sp. Ricciae_BoGa-3]|uniref:peptide ABC transporter substrate-binding protein n=1 Tax=Aneurinibacillus sp. Ricciae_BoGa-3 TaxID=3022697 RepID=UPI00233FD797|nr:peptide ABC transporter substrate-binding protein [Aneurinibacillus sp. Ricciae_BoGa-3]WCK55968.1 peptide ABC transporter substrate-binding protein [Aneurinibacillus sp. Ricciae_BoGa-3]
MKKSVPVLMSLVMAGGIGLTACGPSGSGNSASPGANNGSSSGSTGGKILRVNNIEEPGSLEPGKAQGTHDSWVLENTFEGLTRFDKNAKVVPGDAEKWDISPDGKTYTFHLRDGLKWSNGDPVTAQDYEYAWKYALNPSTASEYAYQLYYIKGAEAYNTTKEKDPKKLQALQDAVAVKAVDDKTLKVELNGPTPYFLELCNFYTYYPVDKKVQAANPKWANDAKTFVSNGPFKLSEWNHKQDVKVVKNENFWDKQSVKIDGISFAMLQDENTAWQMYRSGQLDLAYTLPTEVTGQMKNSNNPEFHNSPEFSAYFYRINTKKKPFDNVKVRKALAMAIDRKTIVDSVAQGGQTPLYGMVPPGYIEKSTGKDFNQVSGPYFKEDVTAAKQLLQQGLKEEGMTSMPKVTILYNTRDDHKKIAEAIQEMWRKNLGINATLENADFQVVIDREHKLDYDVVRAGWISDFVDPMTFEDMWTSVSTQNDTGWTSPEYDKLITAAKNELDNKKREDDLHKAEKLFMDNQPIIPIYAYTKPFMLKSNVTGVYVPVNRYPQLQYVEMK